MLHQDTLILYDIAAYSLAVADYFMAKIMAIYGSGNTKHFNRYGLADIIAIKFSKPLLNN